MSEKVPPDNEGSKESPTSARVTNEEARAAKLPPASQARNYANRIEERLRYLRGLQARISAIAEFIERGVCADISAELLKELEDELRVETPPGALLVQDVYNLAARLRRGEHRLADGSINFGPVITALIHEDSLSYQRSRNYNGVINYLEEMRDAARAIESNGRIIGSWPVAMLTLFSKVGLEDPGACDDPARIKAMEELVRRWKRDGHLRVPRELASPSGK